MVSCWRHWILAKIRVGKRVWLSNGAYDHLSAGDKIKDYISSVMGEKIELDEHQEETWLPEGEKENCFYRYELVERTKRSKSLLGGHVEEHQTV